jgi:hypothetical protein
MGSRVLVAIVAMVVVMALVMAGYAAGYPLMPDDTGPQRAIAAQAGDAGHSLVAVETQP